MAISVSSAYTHLFPLTPDELDAFGWFEAGIRSVMSVRSPDGRRCIPTRQLTGDGDVVYGSIETMEAPGHFSDEAWADEFGSWEDVRPGHIV